MAPPSMVGRARGFDTALGLGGPGVLPKKPSDPPSGERQGKFTLCPGLDGCMQESSVSAEDARTAWAGESLVTAMGGPQNRTEGVVASDLRAGSKF